MSPVGASSALPRTTAPGPVTALKEISITSSSITLTWKDPRSKSFTGVLIRKRQGTTAPATVSSGTYVVNVGAATQFSVPGLKANTPYSFSLFAHDAQKHYAKPAELTAITLTKAAPSFESASSAPFVVGSDGSFSVAASGVPTPTITETGTLPAGVTFSSSKRVLSGAPTVAGSFPITFTASNGVGAPATQPFTLSVSPAPTAPLVTSAAASSFVFGVAGAFTVTASGYPAPTIIESGTLPGGVTYSTSTRLLSGVPTATGVFPVTFTATNGVGSPSRQTFTLTVYKTPVITSVGPSAGGLGGGTTVTITGMNLNGASSVNFGSVQGTIEADTTTSITALSPAHARGPSTLPSSLPPVPRR